MAEADFTKPLPQITSEAQPFWDAAAKQQLVMQRCQDCHAYIWTPRPACFECGSERLEWTQLSGNLSGGEQARVALAKAILLRPKH